MSQGKTVLEGSKLVLGRISGNNILWLNGYAVATSSYRETSIAYPDDRGLLVVSILEKPFTFGELSFTPHQGDKVTFIARVAP
jgi:hypothetical protein